MISRIILLCLCGALPLIHALPGYNVTHVGPESQTVEVPLKYNTIRQEDTEAHELSFTVNGNTFSLYLQPHDNNLMGSNTSVILAHNNKPKTTTYEVLLSAVEYLNMAVFVDNEKNAHAVCSDDNEMMGLLVANGQTFNFVVKNLAEAQPTISITGQIDVLSKNTIDSRNYDNSPSERLVAYPEMLVVLDNEFYENNGRSWENVVKYMYAFWTAVDLQFRSFESPRVRLNIAGIIIATDRGAVPYMSSSIPRILTNGPIFFISKTAALPTSDAIVFIKHESLATEELPKMKVAGASFAKSMCTSDGFMAATDASDYSGVNVATRELAFLLGAKGHINNDYCGKDNNNDLMSSSDLGGFPAMKFSQCTKHEITEFLNSSFAQCIYNKPL